MCLGSPSAEQYSVFQLSIVLLITPRNNPTPHLHFRLTFSAHFLLPEAYSDHQRTLFTENCVLCFFLGGGG